MAQRERSQAELYMRRGVDPRSYWLSPGGIERIAGWAFDGLTQDQISEKMEVDVTSLKRWARRSEVLKKALANNRDSADREVENALRKNALGYTYTETKTTIEIDEDGKKKQKIEKFERQAKPDTIAQVFYLKNRKPDTWRDNQQLDLKATVGLVQIVDDIPKELTKKNAIEGEVVDGAISSANRPDRT